MQSFNILFPVYNEEKRLERGIRKTAAFLETYLPETDFRLTIVDNGSTDKTGQIGLVLEQMYPNVSYMRIAEKGVGAAFRAGVASNTADIVGYMDVDLSTDLRTLIVMRNLFEKHADIAMVNASKQARGARTIGRSWYRELASKGLTLAMKIGLDMKASDAICGFKFFRKPFVEQLIAEADRGENGWFFLIELLIRAERSGEAIAEIPVIYREAEGGHVDVIGQSLDYLKNINKLRRKLQIWNLNE